MKKTLLLSVVASTMIMAGGDITPVEPSVSAWNFTGQAVAYTQTTDAQGRDIMGGKGGHEVGLFEGGSTYGALGLQLGATNANIFSGIGAGVEISAIEQDNGYSRSIHHGGHHGNGNGNGLTNSPQGTAGTESAAITQAYLTYGMANTNLKIGRQTLPKSLSPFAYSESWQIFKNTFEAALVVNSDLPNTTLVYAYVRASNSSTTDISDFSKITSAPKKGAVADENVHMITVQNKSIDNLTLTGSYYLAPNMTGNNVDILWGDAAYNMDGITLSAQGGKIDGDDLSTTNAYGLKAAGSFGMLGVSLAYTSVNDGDVPIYNLGTNVKSPLYTQSILNQNVISKDSDTFKLSASAKALDGKFTAYYVNADLGDSARGAVFYSTSATSPGDNKPATEGTYQELALMYKTKLTANTTVFGAIANQDDSRYDEDSQNFVRIWARYSFN